MKFIHTSQQLIVRPKTFLRAYQWSFSPEQTLFHGLAWMTIGSAIEFMMSFWLVSAWVGKKPWLVTGFKRVLLGMLSQEAQGSVPVTTLMAYGEWFVGLGYVILHPFYGIFVLIFSSTTLWLSLKLFGPEAALQAGRTRFENALTINSFAETAQALKIIPFLGLFASGFFRLYLQYEGVKSLLHCSRARAIFILFAPTLIFYLAIVGALFAVFFAIYQFFAFYF